MKPQRGAQHIRNQAHLLSSLPSPTVGLECTRCGEDDLCEFVQVALCVLEIQEHFRGSDPQNVEACITQVVLEHELIHTWLVVADAPSGPVGRHADWQTLLGK